MLDREQKKRQGLDELARLSGNDHRLRFSVSEDAAGQGADNRSGTPIRLAATAAGSGGALRVLSCQAWRYYLPVGG
jgi:hypothetical protein